MFNRKPETDPGLENAINGLYKEMAIMSVESEEFVKSVDQLVKLYSLKPKNERLSKDALATIAANLFGILLIVGHERANVVTSKALGFVQKLR
jgi:hypothetical protein